MDKSGTFFNSFADKFDTYYDAKRSPLMQWVDFHFRRDMFVRYKMTFDFLGDLSGKSVLDIGCGSGPYLLEALSRGAAYVIGIDPAPRMLALAKRRISRAGMLDKVNLLEGYFPKTCTDEIVDYAIVMGVMDYISDPLIFLTKLRDIITRGAVISFPSTHWFRTPVRKIRYMLRRCPVYFYTENQIQVLLKEISVKHYEIVKIPGAGMDYVVNISKQ
jgi:SAM-dependent methyltransferase